jgi:hypothetical protein
MAEAPRSQARNTGERAYLEQLCDVALNSKSCRDRTAKGRPSPYRVTHRDSFDALSEHSGGDVSDDVDERSEFLRFDPKESAVTFVNRYAHQKGVNAMNVSLQDLLNALSYRAVKTRARRGPGAQTVTVTDAPRGNERTRPPVLETTLKDTEVVTALLSQEQLEAQKPTLQEQLERLALPAYQEVAAGPAAAAASGPAAAASGPAAAAASSQPLTMVQHLENIAGRRWDDYAIDDLSDFNVDRTRALNAYKDLAGEDKYFEAGFKDVWSKKGDRFAQQATKNKKEPLPEGWKIFKAKKEVVGDSNKPKSFWKFLQMVMEKCCRQGDNHALLFFFNKDKTCHCLLSPSALQIATELAKNLLKEHRARIENKLAAENERNGWVHAIEQRRREDEKQWNLKEIKQKLDAAHASGTISSNMGENITETRYWQAETVEALLLFRQRSNEVSYAKTQDGQKAAFAKMQEAYKNFRKLAESEAYDGHGAVFEGDTAAAAAGDSSRKRSASEALCRTHARGSEGENEECPRKKRKGSRSVTTNTSASLLDRIGVKFLGVDDSPDKKEVTRLIKCARGLVENESSCPCKARQVALPDDLSKDDWGSHGYSIVKCEGGSGQAGKLFKNLRILYFTVERPEGFDSNDYYEYKMSGNNFRALISQAAREALVAFSKKVPRAIRPFEPTASQHHCRRSCDLTFATFARRVPARRRSTPPARRSTCSRPCARTKISGVEGPWSCSTAWSRASLTTWRRATERWCATRRPWSSLAPTRPRWSARASRRDSSTSAWRGRELARQAEARVVAAAKSRRAHAPTPRLTFLPEKATRSSGVDARSRVSRDALIRWLLRS